MNALVDAVNGDIIEVGDIVKLKDKVSAYTYSSIARNDEFLVKELSVNSSGNKVFRAEKLNGYSKGSITSFMRCDNFKILLKNDISIAKTASRPLNTVILDKTNGRIEKRCNHNDVNTLVEQILRKDMNKVLEIFTLSRTASVGSLPIEYKLPEA